MKLMEFLKTSGKRSAELSREAGITKASLSNFLSGTRGLSAQTMAKIVAATGGEVSYEDLVAEMQERQEARKNGNVG